MVVDDVVIGVDTAVVVVDDVAVGVDFLVVDVEDFVVVVDSFASIVIKVIDALVCSRY